MLVEAPPLSCLSMTSTSTMSKNCSINAYMQYFELYPGESFCRAANYYRTLDNVRLNLENVRAKVILIGHWSDLKKKLSHYTFFCCGKIRLQIHQFAFCNKICILQ
jgi:hypothetical protein